MPDINFLILGGSAAIVGAIVQSSVGLGLGLVAAPIVTLLFPSLMPGSLLVAACVLPMFTLIREFRHADVTGLGWAFGGRIVGTPLALLYQRDKGPKVRATLAVFFTVGALLSLVTLAAVDQLPGDQVIAGLALTPFAFAGFVMAGPVRRFLDAGRLRTGILVVTTASAVALIVRSLM